MRRKTYSLLKKRGVYRIICLVNGACYVGATSDAFGVRFSAWRTHLRLNSCNKRITADWRLFGEDAFRFEVLEVVDNFDQIQAREQFWIDTLRPVYNILRAGKAQQPRSSKGCLSKTGHLASAVHRLECGLDRTGDCWMWTGGSITVNGGHQTYGRLSIGSGGSKQHLYVHRLAYMIWVGAIVDGATVYQTCGNTLCCNPNHLTTSAV